MIESLSKGALALAIKLQTDDQKPMPGLAQPSLGNRNMPVTDGVGGSFFVEPKRAHFSFRNSHGKTQGSIVFPPDSSASELLRAAATELVQDSECDQDEALAHVTGAPTDTTIPPPGYKIKFGGKGILIQSGPPISFGPISEESIAKRLVGVLQLDTTRDQADPGNKGIPEPDACFVVIEGPSGHLSFDFPCKSGWTEASKKVVSVKAALLAKQIEAINRKVLRSSQEAMKTTPHGMVVQQQQIVSTQAIHGPH
jgi:hypothetical protein